MHDTHAATHHACQFGQMRTSHSRCASLVMLLPRAHCSVLFNRRCAALARSGLGCAFAWSCAAAAQQAVPAAAARRGVLQPLGKCRHAMLIYILVWQARALQCVVVAPMPHEEHAQGKSILQAQHSDHCSRSERACLKAEHSVNAGSARSCLLLAHPHVHAACWRLCGLAP